MPNGKGIFLDMECKKIVLIYDDVERVEEQHAVFGDISAYIEKRVNDGLLQYEFWDVNDEVVLSILAKSVKIYEVGENADIDSALFHLGCDYIGGQHRTKYLSLFVIGIVIPANQPPLFAKDHFCDLAGLAAAHFRLLA